MKEIIHQLRPDAKGRISLGKLARGVSSFRAHLTEDGTIVLQPYAEVPAREKWIFDNPEALNSVRAGLSDAATGTTVSRGSFSRYIEDKID